MNAQEFKISPDGFKQFRKKIIIRAIPRYVIIFAAIIAISLFNQRNDGADVNVLPYTLPLIAVALGFGLYRGLNRQKALFSSYRLIVANDGITREQMNTPTVSLSNLVIREIVRNKNGSFTIKGKGPREVILVPAEVDNYEMLYESLNKIIPITEKSTDPFFKKYGILLSIVMLALLIAVYTLEDKLAVGTCGTILVAFMIFSFYKVQTNPNIDYRTKRGSWILLLVILSLIATIIMKLLNRL